MYSIVLMTALTATPDAPQFNGFFRDLFNGGCSGCSGCNGCNGCSGGARYSASGCCGSSAYPTSCTGCSGSAYSSCSGCCGSSCYGSIFGLGDRVRSWFARDNGGCCGGRSYSCTGYSCSGSAYSCFGAPTSYTPVCDCGMSCQGGIPYSAPPPMFDTFPNPGVPSTPNIPYAVPDPAPGTVGARSTGQTLAALTSNEAKARATVIVKLPEDARLFADGRALTLKGTERKFVSPELPVDQEFVYRFRAEYERDGETVSVTKKVPVRANTTAVVEFVDLTVARPAPSEATAASTKKNEKSTLAKPTGQETTRAEPPIVPTPTTPAKGSGSDRAMITVKLPPGAALYVDDRKSPSADPVRSFSTPLLPSGREYAYLLKAEVMRNGQPETLSQKVLFRAGERVIVDFTSLGR